MSELYYQPPAEHIFQEVKDRAIDLWNTFDDKFGYATGKINRIKDIENVEDNFMMIVAMFDIHNQGKLAMTLGVEARTEIRKRLLAVEYSYIVF